MKDINDVVNDVLGCHNSELHWSENIYDFDTLSDIAEEFVDFISEIRMLLENPVKRAYFKQRLSDVSDSRLIKAGEMLGIIEDK